MSQALGRAIKAIRQSDAQESKKIADHLEEGVVECNGIRPKTTYHRRYDGGQGRVAWAIDLSARRAGAGPKQEPSSERS
jgi:hypothetical protein